MQRFNNVITNNVKIIIPILLWPVGDLRSLKLNCEMYINSNGFKTKKSGPDVLDEDLRYEVFELETQIWDMGQSSYKMNP